MESIDVLANDPEIKPLLAVNYLRHHQRKERSREVEDMTRVLTDPAERKKLINPGKLKLQNDERRQTLEAQTPPPLTVSQRDKIARLNVLTLDSARDGMPSQEEVRHAPHGIGDKIIAWEKAKKQYILWWKRSQILLNPDSTDRHLCNFEKHRPSRPTHDLMGDARIPGVFTLSPQAKENWDQMDWGKKETQEEFVKRMEAQGIKVKFTRSRPLRLPKDGGKVYQDKDTGQIFSGPRAKAQYKRHMKAKEKRKIAAEQASA